MKVKYIYTLSCSSSDWHEDARSFSFQTIISFKTSYDSIATMKITYTHTHNQMYYVGYTILFWHTHKLLLRVRARAHIPRDTSLEIEFTNEPKKKKKYTHSTNNNNRNIKIKNKRAQLTY